MKNLDDWFLQYRTHAVHGKQKKIRSGTSHKPLKNNTALTNLQAAARKHPEVMVKIPKRQLAELEQIITEHVKRVGIIIQEHRTRQEN